MPKPVTAAQALERASQYATQAEQAEGQTMRRNLEALAASFVELARDLMTKEA